MSNITGGCDAPKRPKGRQSVFEITDARRKGNAVGDTHLKKGPWTAAEDAILVEYVKKHGEGNWNAVQKHSGLARCGKSCRLRWANHLRPELKKGAFTDEEEHLIVELHAKMGNKWARMATELPGRTDNEIKNYWNTRIKRRQRAGLPIYPPEVSQRVRSQESHSVDSMVSGASQHSSILQDGIYNVPELEFKNLDYSSAYELDPSITDISESSLFSQPVGSPYNDLFSFGDNLRFLRESDLLYNRLDNGNSRMIHAIDKFANYPAEQPLLSSPSNLPIDTNHLFRGDNDLHGSHATLNGTFSSSAPVPEAMKMELPSLQYLETQQGTWDTNVSPIPSLESVDKKLQSTPVQQFQSNVVTPNSGLLESIIYDPRLPRGSNNNGSLWNATDERILNVVNNETKLDQNPHFGYSPGSVLHDYTPPVSVTSGEDPNFMEHTIGHEIRQEAISQVPPHVQQSQETYNRLDITTRPDALLGMGWFGSDTGYH